MMSVPPKIRTLFSASCFSLLLFIPVAEKAEGTYHRLSHENISSGMHACTNHHPLYITVEASNVAHTLSDPRKKSSVNHS